MKFSFKFILLYIFLFFHIFPQSLYTKYIKKDEALKILVDKDFMWVFLMPFDFQYNIYKEGNYVNFEGKNLGEEKIFIKTSAIKNQKKMDLDKFKKEFFYCKYPFHHIENKNFDLENSILSSFQLCSDNIYYQLKTFIVYNNIIHLLYIIWVQNLPEEDQKRIRVFINNIQYKLESS